MENREAARHAIAERIRAEHSRASKRNRFVVGLIVVAIVLVCVVALVWAQLQPSNADDANDIPTPQHATDTYGFTLTPEMLGTEVAPTVEVAVFEDFLCDSCKTFHEQSTAFLHDEVAAGTISLTYHPFAFLLTQSTDEYSQRAANAAACVADAAGVSAYAGMHNLLMTNQPAMGGPGLSDDRLIELGLEAGQVDVSECVTERTFDAWIAAATQAGLAAEVSETPTVRINGMNVVRSNDGQESMPGPDELRFVIEASK